MKIRALGARAIDRAIDRARRLGWDGEGGNVEIFLGLRTRANGGWVRRARWMGGRRRVG